MKTEYTLEETRQFLRFMQDDNDIVRLVDPLERKVVLADGTEDARQETFCHTFWGRCGRCENCTSLRALQTKGQAYKIEVLDGHTYWVYSRYFCVNGLPRVAEMLKDVTDNLLMDSDQQDQIGKMITSYNQMLITDSLTGVYNRRFLDEHFLPSLHCCHENGITINLAFLDMDGFKKVNDTYGHSAGDQILKDVAGFWKLHFNSRENNRERLVIRFGGDELMIIACGISQARFEGEIQRYYGEMRKVCYYTAALQFSFDFTFGIASSEQLGPNWTWDELVNLADKRMYLRKNRGGK